MNKKLTQVNKKNMEHRKYSYGSNQTFEKESNFGIK